MDKSAYTQSVEINNVFLSKIKSDFVRPQCCRPNNIRNDRPKIIYLMVLTGHSSTDNARLTQNSSFQRRWEPIARGIFFMDSVVSLVFLFFRAFIFGVRPPPPPPPQPPPQRWGVAFSRCLSSEDRLVTSARFAVPLIFTVCFHEDLFYSWYWTVTSSWFTGFCPLH